MQVKYDKFNNRKNGFILFIAIVVASIFLSIAVGIANFTYRELILSSTARNSMYAFYAADAGIECALYYDNVLNSEAPRKPSAFEPEPPIAEPPPDTPAPLRPDAIQCADNNIILEPCRDDPDNFNRNCRAGDSFGNILTEFGFSLYPNEDSATRPFVRVVVEKGEEGGPPAIPTTWIRARGVNINNPENLRRVERGLKTKYAK